MGCHSAKILMSNRNKYLVWGGVTSPRIEPGSEQPHEGQHGVGFHFFDTTDRNNQTRRYLLVVPASGHKGGSYLHRTRRSVIGELSTLVEGGNSCPPLPQD